MSLYTKYRPKRFADIVGQEFVRISLANALRLDRTVGAYLFTGSRGVGKTTAARIFAKALNCTGRGEDGEPCGACANCLAIERGEFVDIVEIDAASHTGVDNIRDIIEKSRFLPTSGTKKVYIVDEVHMLSKGAFNALLKTLEEPPDHVVFIMATTEIERIPETIVSRAQRFDFGRISVASIAEHLRSIATSENTSAEDRALEYLARAANGGLRDALTLFEQYSIDGTLSAERVESSLSILSDERLDALIVALDAGNVAGIEDFVGYAVGRSFVVRRVLEQILSHLRDRMRASSSSGEIARFSRYFSRCFRAYEQCKSLVDPTVILSAGLYACIAGDVPEPAPIASESRPVARPVTPVPANKPAPPSFAFVPEPAPIVEPIREKPTAAAIATPATPAPERAAAASGDFDFRVMTDAIRAMPKRVSLAMSLKSSRYEFRDGILSIFAPNGFHLGKLESEDSLGCMRSACQECFGLAPEIRVSLDGTPRRDLAQAAEEIF
jgi:DNA polymerase III subunit gamma/tau